MSKRILIAASLSSWTAASIYLVWFTELELIGVAGFLVLVSMNVYFKKANAGGVA